MKERQLPTHQGRFGVRQFDVLTGDQCGGTVWMGWPTREDAVAANPDTSSWRYEVYDRWPYLAAGETLDWRPLSGPQRPVETVQLPLPEVA